LTVSDKRSFAEGGVHVTFTIKNKKTGFILNEKAVTESKFKVDYRFRKIAEPVNRNSKD
jgi:hypothetical protein